MKRIAFGIIILCISSLFAQANGEMWDVDGKMVLRVWGTHHERGYAQGYYLAEAFMDVFENYMFNYACYGNPTFYNQARMLFENGFVIEDDYMTEAEAMIEGAIDSGHDLYFEPLERELDANDVLMANALIDLSGLTRISEDIFACSSISSWGTSTENDETLQGGLVITRMMDWATNASLFRNPLVLVSIPSEEDEQNWVSITFPGLFGGLSAINENGLTTFLDMGNNHSNNDNGGFYPILLTLRNGIEKVDYDEDGEQTPQDIVQAVEDRNRAIGTIVHVTLDSENLPVVIENNNAAGVSVRDVDDNTVVQGDNLVATNHFRTLYSPVSCSGTTISWIRWKYPPRSTTTAVGTCFQAPPAYRPTSTRSASTASIARSPSRRHRRITRPTAKTRPSSSSTTSSTRTLSMTRPFPSSRANRKPTPIHSTREPKSDSISRSSRT